MKRLFFPAIVACLAVFASCRKETQGPNTQTSPANNLFVAASFQGANWVAQPTTTFNSTNDSLTVKGFYQAANQTLVFKIQFNGPGTYNLTSSTQAYYYRTDSAGVRTSFYKLDTTQTTNSVTITSFDPSIDIATGSFQLSLVKTSGNASEPNTADFTNGKLWVQVPVKR